MKIFIYLLIIISTTLISSVIGDGCSADWECGSQPFSACKKNKTVVDFYDNRIDIDRVNSRVYFSVKYPDEFEIRIISIPVDGLNSNGKGAISHATLYGQSTYQLIRGLIQLVGPVSNSLVVNRLVRIAGTTTNIYFRNNTFGNELTWITPGNFIFNEQTNTQYTCWPYTSKIAKGKIGEYNNLGDTIYQGTVSEMRNLGNQLFISDIYGTIRLGNLNGPWLNGGTLIINLPIVFTQPRMGSFELSSTDIYYSHKDDLKIYKSPITSSNGAVRIVILNEIPTSFKYHNNYLYYQSGSKISRVSTLVANSTPEILFDSTSLVGHCICEQGFTGVNCDQCDQSKNIISWVNGRPRCIPYSWSTNNPVTCDYDYQCKPYAVSTCKEIVLSGGNKGCTNVY